MERYTAIFAQLSPLGIFLAALAIIVVGSAWYSRALFGKAWMRHSGIRSTDITAGEARRGYLLSFIAALVQSVLLALIVDHAGEKWHMFAIGIFVVWLFIFIELFNRFIWERSSFSLVLIQAFRSLASLMAASFTYHFVS